MALPRQKKRKTDLQLVREEINGFGLKVFKFEILKTKYLLSKNESELIFNGEMYYLRIAKKSQTGKSFIMYFMRQVFNDMKRIFLIHHSGKIFLVSLNSTDRNKTEL